MESFIKEDPKSKYTLDGQRDSGEGTICRRTPTGLNCVRLNMEAKQLFTEMQVRIILLHSISADFLATRLLLCAAHGPNADRDRM